MRRIPVLMVTSLIVVGCEASNANGDAATTTAPSGTSSTTQALPPEHAEVDVGSVEYDEVRDELVEMAEADQAERSQFGDPDAGPWNDEERTARLMAIIDEYGWPTPERFGDEASTAAWLIVQHSDTDPAFQQRVLSMLTNEVSDYAGKEGQVALLTDRVATNTDRPQLYGSQIGCVDSTPVPRPELERPGDVDQLRADAGLEPLDQYLARFEQHCADLARRPIDAGCDPIAGVSGLLQPNTAILVGELHGTVESPAFVNALTCTALSYGFDVIVGLEIPDDETAAVRRFITSDGGPDATAELLAERFWTSEFADGRQSTAMFELLDALRRHVADGAMVDVVLLDAIGGANRDAAMADQLIDALQATPDGLAITLTGNVHNRRTRGGDADPSYEPMGYLVARTLGDGAVRALDVSHTGGAAWTCSQDQACGPRSFDGNPDGSEYEGDSFAVELFTQPNPDGFDGVYFVGELTPSAPASESVRSAD